MKRILIIVGILIAAVAIVAVGVLLRGGLGGPSAGPSDPLPPGGTLPIVGTSGSGAGDAGTGGFAGGASGNDPGNSGVLPTGGVSAVGQAAVIDYAVTPDGVMFLATNGAVISASGGDAVGQADFGDILGAWFSPDGKWLLVKSGSETLASWNILDIAKKTWRALQTNTSRMAWSPGGSQLAYFAPRTNGSTLTTYSPATNSTRSLLAFSAPDLSVQWKDASHMLILDQPSSLVPGTVWDFSIAGSRLEPFATNISGGQVLWGGPDSGGLLFKAGPTGGILSIVNSAGAALQSTSFLTLPSKCFFGESAATSTISNIESYLFCAIPQNQTLMKESQLPDDYFKGKFGTTDTIYAIGLNTGKLAPVLTGSQSFNFDATNLRIYGGDLYFVNRNDGKLYRVSLSALAALESIGD